MNNKPELIVFDLAGTTVEDNQDVHRVLQMAMEYYDTKITLAEANAVMGIPKPIAIERLLKLHLQPDITPELIFEIHAVFLKNMIEFYCYDTGVREKQGVSATFERLQADGIKVAVDTGFDRSITNALLKRMKWKENNLIDASVTSDEVERGRPFPDLIFEAMKRTGVLDSAKVAKVGDTSFDLQEGRSAGCGWVIGITTGAFSKAELELEKPTHLIETIPEIIGMF
ncbi:phosphonatase-like hydrolase [soil metagenome]